MESTEDAIPHGFRRRTQYLIYCKNCGYSLPPTYEIPLEEDTGLCPVCCLAKLTVTTETFLTLLTEQEKELQTLTALKDELVKMFGWTDTSSLHALLHVRSAIYHFANREKNDD